MKRNHFLTLAAMAMLTLGLTACNEEDAPYDGITMTNGYVLEVETQDHDASASYPVHFSMTFTNDSLIVTGLTSKPSSEQGLGSRDCPTAVVIADYGKVGSLSKIDSYTTDEGTFGAKALAVEKHGYIIKAWGNAHLDAYGSDILHDPDTLYTRVWLEEATDNGYNARYEVNYTVE